MPVSMFLPNNIGLPSAPAGAVMAFAGPIPVGWLECNGATYNRTDYPELFAAIGGASSPWGLPSGTTFQVPNLDGRTIIGESGTYALASATGAATHTLTTAEIPSHLHDDGTLVAQRSSVAGANNIAGRASSATNQGTTTDDINIGGNTGLTGGGGAHNNMQPSMPMYYAICTGKVLSLQTQNQPYQIVTSSTRPGSPYEGLSIYETDTDVMRIHTGGAWRIPYPLGRLADNNASGSSGAMTTTNVVTLPSTSYTINNTDGVTRRYTMTVEVRVNMASGSNGLYRPLVTDGSTTSLGGGSAQFMATVTGSSGQTGGSTEWSTTVAAGGSLTVGAGGLRVTGGGTTDTFVGGQLRVYDDGPA